MRLLRPIVFGLGAIALAFLLGTFLPGLQNPIALALIFVLAVPTGAIRGEWLGHALLAHPSAAAFAAVLVVVLGFVAFVYLVSPAYVHPY